MCRPEVADVWPAFDTNGRDEVDTLPLTSIFIAPDRGKEKSQPAEIDDTARVLEPSAIDHPAAPPLSSAAAAVILTLGASPVPVEYKTTQ